MLKNDKIFDWLETTLIILIGIGVLFIGLSLFVSYLMVIFDFNALLAKKNWILIKAMIKLIHQNWIFLIVILFPLFYRHICLMMQRMKKLPFGAELDSNITSTKVLPKINKKDD